MLTTQHITAALTVFLCLTAAIARPVQARTVTPFRAQPARLLSLPLRATRTAHGITVTLSAPRRVYPRAALARLSLRVTNRNKRPVDLIQGDCRGNSWSPTVMVLTKRGDELPANPLPHPPLDNVLCTGPPPPRLAPGATWTLHPFVVLRGNRVRAAVVVNGTHTVTTPALGLRRTREAPPAVTVSEIPTLHATVQSAPPGATGGPYYSDWYTCPTQQGELVGGQRFSEEASPLTGGSQPFLTGAPMQWTHVSGPVLAPGCSHPGQWHLVAGWLNHPVTRVNYTGGVVPSLAQAQPSLQAVSLHRAHLHAGVLGRGWSPGSIVAVVIHLPAPTKHGKLIPVVVSPTAGGEIEVGFAGVPCGGTRVVARDSLNRKASLSFTAPCTHPRAALRNTRVLKGRSGRTSQRVYLAAPRASTSVTLHLGDSLYVWEYGTTPPSFVAGGGAPNLVFLARLPSGPWIGCPVQGCPAATTWGYVALVPGNAVIHMTPGCSGEPGCAAAPFDIDVHVEA